MFLKPVAISDDSGQSHAIVGLKEDADGLCHAPRFAWITTIVSSLFGSVHYVKAASASPIKPPPTSNTIRASPENAEQPQTFGPQTQPTRPI
jgi:hypothetical protein